MNRIATGSDIMEALRLAFLKPAQDQSITLSPGLYTQDIVIDRCVQLVCYGAVLKGQLVCSGRHGASITGLTIVNTDAYAVDIMDGSDVHLVDCSFTSEYEVVRIRSASPVLSKCRIFNGLHVGITVYGPRQAEQETGCTTIEDCIVHDNLDGGIAIIKCEAIIRNSIIRCTTECSSCIYISRASGHIYNNILYHAGMQHCESGVETDSGNSGNSGSDDSTICVHSNVVVATQQYVPCVRCESCRIKTRNACPAVPDYPSIL